MTAHKNVIPSEPQPERMRALAIDALDVVFGDIGTSPLYALRQYFSTAYGISEKMMNVHRGRIMEKLRIDSVAELIRLEMAFSSTCSFVHRNPPLSMRPTE